MSTNKQKVRYAVVGQGWFAQAAVLPAFAHADNSELTALVTGDPKKAKELGARYGVPAVLYDQYEELLTDGGVDAVYIALPNSQHHEFTVRAAQAGAHVLCEKPMAPTAAECQEMIEVCALKKVRLMIAYRLHFEEANLSSIEALRSGRLGEPRAFHSFFVQQVEEGNIRVEAEEGGGPLGDVGIYCINAARYLFRAEPTEVAAFAASRDQERFAEVPEMVSALLRFPGERLATFTCGFGEGKVSTYRVVGTKGDLTLDPAYTFHDAITQRITVGGETEERTFEKRDQVGAEIAYFSDCVLRGKEPEPSGQEGLIDARIIEALQESFAHGRVVKLALPGRTARPGMGQSIKLPPVEEQELVHAAPPSGD